MKLSTFKPATTAFCLSFTLAISSTFGQAYGPEISNITIKDGMSQNTVTSIVQDKKGFLWIGTNDGLNKYDGHSFKIFTSSSNDASSLGNNLIRDIELDEDDNLWIGTQVGLTKFNSRTGVFSRFLESKEQTDHAIGNVISDLAIHNESMWIGTNQGILYVEEKSKPSFKRISSVVGEDSEFLAVNGLTLDNLGNLWTATSAGLFFVEASTQQGYKLDLKHIVDLSSEIHCIAYLSDRIWFTTEVGVFSFDPKNTTHEEDKFVIRASNIKAYKVPVSPFFGQKIFKDQNDVVWLGTRSQGVYTLGSSNKTFEPFTASFQDNPHIFSAINVTEIFEDESHNIWIGSLETGLFKVRTSSKKFGLLKSMARDSKGLSSNRIRGLIETGDYLWIGTAQGLNRYNRKSLTCRIFKHDPRDENSISSNDVKTMDIDEQGDLWIATDHGLNQLDTTTFKFKRFYHTADDEKSLLRSNRIRAVKTLSDGNMWIGALGGGISVINPISSKLVTQFVSDPLDTLSLSNNNVMDIFEASDHSIWVSTYGGGLNKLRKNQTSFLRVQQDGISKLLSSIHEDPDGFLWIGSYGDGLFRVHPEDLTFRVYTQETGLSNDVVYAAVPHKNSIWISTNNGLNKYNRLLRYISKYNYTDGLQSNEFNSGSYLKSESGQLFFGGVNGLTFFYPDSIKSNKLPPQLAFTDFRIFNKSVKPNEVVVGGKPPLKELVADSGTISLSYLHNVFTVEFASLDYTSPEDNRYAYKLAGFDKEWIYTDSKQRAITYTNLKPGKYTFMMKAANDDGVWTEQPILLFIDIMPALWQKWWFKTLTFFIVISLLGGFVYRRVTKTQRRRKYLESEIQKRTKEIYEQNEILVSSENHLKTLNKKKDQMFYALAHHVRGPLTTLVSLMRHSNSEEDQIENEVREKYLRQLNGKVGHSLLLLDNTYYWSLMEFDELDPKTEMVNISQVARQCVKRHEIAAALKSVSVQMDEGEDHFVKCDQNMTSIIIQNLVTNAIKYSHNGDSIKVRFVADETKLKLVVEDNGVGISKDELNRLFDENQSVSAAGTQNEKGSGLGLHLSNRMAKKMNFGLCADSETSCTKFYLHMPLG